MLPKTVSHKGPSHSLCFPAVPPTIIKGDVSGMDLSPKEVKIRVNHSLTLECEAHAIPAAAISWYKDGQASHKLNSFLWVAFVQNNCVCAVCEHSCSGTGLLPLLKSAGSHPPYCPAGRIAPTHILGHLLCARPPQIDTLAFFGCLAVLPRHQCWSFQGLPQACALKGKGPA